VAGEIVVGTAAIEVVRVAGPTGWAVLTALAVDAEYAAGEVVARASVRSLAAVLGLDKDTVARALTRLRESGFVVHEAGRFTPGVYRLTTPPAWIRFAVDAPAARSDRRHAAEDSAFQLALLEAD
jgi:DNA-binding IclR family transcriptional regulator